jgi:cysteinyl-tRNA synthetase
LDAGAIARFEQAMDEDFNSPGAIAVLFELAKELRRQGNLLVHEGEIQGDSQRVQKQWQTLVSLAGVLGLKVDADAELSPTPSDGLSDEAIAALLERRQAARQAKDFAEADRIRDELQAQGIVTIDRPGGVTQWHRS